MSEGNRSRYVAVGLAATALLVVIFGFGAFSYWMGNLSGFSEANAQGYQAEYAEFTDKRVAHCFENVAAPRECVEKAIRDNYQQQRDESDLQAQRDMANWAFWGLVISGSGLCVTAIGTIFLAWQVKLTRQAVEDTEKATASTAEANRIAQSIGQTQVRAYLSIEKVDCSIVESGICFRAFIKNSGNSPALASQIIIHLIHGDGSKTKIEPLEEHTVPAQSTVQFAECYAFYQHRELTILAEVRIGFCDVFGMIGET